LQQGILTPITAVFGTKGIKLKGDTEGTFFGLLLRVSIKIRLKSRLKDLGINFAIILITGGYGGSLSQGIETMFY